MPPKLARLSRALRVATLLVMAGLLLLLGLGSFGLPLWGGLGSSRIDEGQRLALMLVQGLPALGYLWALWSAQRALGLLAAGHTFTPILAQAMRRMGAGVLAGALLQVFAVINLLRVLLGGSGSYLYLDPSAIVLGAVGAALILLASVVDRGRALQAELDEIL